MRGFVFSLFIVLGLAATAFADDPVIRIYYTGAIRGELEPCGCSPALQSGGLSRLSEFVRNERAAKRDFILIDAGNSAGKDTAQGRLKTETLVKAFSIIGFDAVAGLSEDANASGFEAGLFAKYKIASIQDNKANKTTDSIIVRRAKHKVNITINPHGQKKNALNVLLTEKKAAEVSRIGWDVIITSSGELIEAPVVKDNTIIVSGYERGQKLGMLSLRVDMSGKIRLDSHNWQPLPLDAPEDAAVRKIITEYDHAVAELMKDEETRQAGSGPYLGAFSCKDCHAPHFESYGATGHPKAFEALEKAGKSRNPECVVCHTTGYGTDGGFISKTSTPGLAGVGCEVCHGPGKEHLDDLSRQVFRSISAEVCLKCHTHENSPGFDYETYRKKIIHQQQ